MRLLHMIGYALMAFAASVYLMIDMAPPLPGLAVFSTFVGAAFALHKSHTINFNSSDKLGVTLDTIRVGGLTILCLALIAVGKEDWARPALMTAAIAVVIIFVLQMIFGRWSAPELNP